MKKVFKLLLLCTMFFTQSCKSRSENISQEKDVILAEEDESQYRLYIEICKEVSSIKCIYVAKNQNEKHMDYQASRMFLLDALRIKLDGSFKEWGSVKGNSSSEVLNDFSSLKLMMSLFQKIESSKIFSYNFTEKENGHSEAELNLIRELHGIIISSSQDRVLQYPHPNEMSKTVERLRIDLFGLLTGIDYAAITSDNIRELKLKLQKFLSYGVSVEEPRGDKPLNNK